MSHNLLFLMHTMSTQVRDNADQYHEDLYTYTRSLSSSDIIVLIRGKARQFKDKVSKLPHQNIKDVV